MLSLFVVTLALLETVNVPWEQPLGNGGNSTFCSMALESPDEHPWWRQPKRNGIA
ncbi:unnamed protein product [marine sediment metagenome]|uniref:Uncharacterized protein n=1 Tax=marine sediment metagenome TaxID=412755 RepID=X0UC57_9ZZZZ